MGKSLKTAGAIIGGAVLIATGVGALVGVNVAAMGIASFTGSLTIGQLGMISSGLSAVGGMLDKPKSAGSGSPTEWTSNPDQPIPFAFGRVGVAGKIIHRDEYGPDNRLQGIVSVFSGAGPIQGFVSYTAGDIGVGFESNGGTAVGKYHRQMWRSWRLGAQPDTALTLPTGLDGGAVMPAWGPAYALSGKACDLLTLQQDSKFSVYPAGEPKPLVVLNGIYGYDPRYDDTYPGGSGECRFGVRSTYRYIDNPIIAALNWALGLVENGQVVGGVGAGLNGVDLPAFVEAANVADANGWKVTAWPDTSEDVSSVLDLFLQAGGAVRARHAGKISCVTRGAPRPSIATITRRDTAGPIELDLGASRFDRLNTITPRFMSEAHKWQITPANPVAFAELVTEDGGKRSDQIDYRFVPAAKQAAELAAYDILDAREPFSGAIPLKPHMRALKRGDCFVIDEPGFMLDGVKCLVLGRSYDPNSGMVRVAFRSETDSKHPLALGKTTTMPDYPGLTPGDPTQVNPPLPGDWNIVPRPPNPDGSHLPGFDLKPITGNVSAYRVLVEYGLSAEGPWTVAYEGPPTTDEISITVPSGGSYWIRITYYNQWLVPSEPVVYGPFTTTSLIAILEDQLMDQLESLRKLGEELGGRVGDIIGGIVGDQGLAAQAIFGLAADIEARQRFSQELGFIEGELVGTYAQRRTTEAFDGINGLVEDVSLIGVRTPDGLGWLLRSDAVEIEDGVTLVGALAQMQAETAAVAASVIDLTEITAGQAEAAARQLSLIGIEDEDEELFRLSETTLYLGERGPLGEVIESLILSGEGYETSINSLLSVTEDQASALTTLSAEVGDFSGDIQELFEVSEGIGARWSVRLNASNQVIGLMGDAGTRSWVFNGASFSIVDAGNGLSYEPATGRLKVVRGARKLVLGARPGLTLWEGPNSIGDGGESWENIGVGGLALGSDVPGGGLFTGTTLSGPFDSGTTAVLLSLTTSFADIAVATKFTRAGQFIFWPSFDHQGVGIVDGEGYAYYEMEWRIVSTNAAGGDVEELQFATTGQGQFGSNTFGWVTYAPFPAFMGVATSKSGDRRIRLQARLSYGISASVRNRTIRGFYGV